MCSSVALLFFLTCEYQRTSLVQVSVVSKSQFLMRTLDHEMQLMRRYRYLHAVPELRWDFGYHEMADEVFGEVYSDWADGPRTRRSTGGGLVFWGWHVLDRRGGCIERLEVSSFQTSCSPWM